MILFVISVLIAEASAGRLEHLENSYLPPNGVSSGSSNGVQGSPGLSSSGSFAAAPGLKNNNAGSSYGQASNQYLSPKEELSASNVAPQFAGTQGFAQNSNGQQYGENDGYVYNKPQSAPQQYAVPSTNYGTPVGSVPTSNTNFQAQYPEQSVASSNQYQAPQTNPFENIPQQSFDEETGYHY